MDPLSTLVLAWLYRGEINESEISLPAKACAEAARVIEADLASNTHSRITRLQLAGGAWVPLIAAECVHACFATEEAGLMAEAGAVTIEPVGRP